MGKEGPGVLQHCCAAPGGFAEAFDYHALSLSRHACPHLSGLAGSAAVQPENGDPIDKRELFDGFSYAGMEAHISTKLPRVTAKELLGALRRDGWTPYR